MVKFVVCSYPIFRSSDLFSQAQLPVWLKAHNETSDFECSAEKEFVQLNYNSRSWRISEANKDYSYVFVSL